MNSSRALVVGRELDRYQNYPPRVKPAGEVWRVYAGEGAWRAVAMAYPERGEVECSRNSSYGDVEELDAEVAAVVRALSTTVKMLVSEPPNEVRAAMAATETRAAIRPYSMAVAPDSSLTNLTKMRLSMLFSKRLCAWMFVAGKATNRCADLKSRK